MTEIRKRAFVGIVGLVSAGLFSVGCSSSSNTTGTGGSTGSAGHAGGGTTGSAGTTGGGGTTGAGGTTAAACTVAPAALITDFGTGTAQVGTPYTGAAATLTAPTVTTATGSLVMTFATGAVTVAADNYAYVGLPFNACVDASAYTGVKFNISGTLSTGCTIQFSTVDKEHSTAANSGTCAAASCYASSSVFTLPAAATDTTVAFASQTGGGADVGAAVVDPSEILNVQWQINVPTAGCTGTVTVDNVTFTN